MILAVIILIGYIYIINIRFFNKRSKSFEGNLKYKYPNGPLILPIIGSLYRVSLKYPHLSFKQLSDKYGKVFSLKMGSIDTIVINDINFLQKAFRDNPTYFAQRYSLPSFYYAGKNQDIIFGNGSRWRKMRNILTSSITKSKLRQMEELFNDEYFKAEQYLIKKINQDGNNIINIGPIFKRLLVNILYRFLFGVSFEYDDSLLSKEFYSFIQSYNKIFELLSNQPADFIPLFKPFNTYKEIEKEYNSCINFFQPLIDNILNNLNEQNSPKCFLEHFVLEIQKDTSTEIKMTDLPYLCFDIVVAGSDTTSTVLEWMLLFLSNYQDVQEKLFNEINIPCFPSFKDKSQFQYLNSIIKETLRVSPPGPFALPHLCTEDIIIDDIYIPKNTQVIPNLYECNRSNIENKVDGSNCNYESNVFNPDRFMVSTHNSCSLSSEISFSSGLRQCPGLNIADSIIFLVSTKLYKSFKFERISSQLYNEKGYLTKTLSPTEFKSKITIR